MHSSARRGKEKNPPYVTAERMLDSLIKYGNRTYEIRIYSVGSAPVFIYKMFSHNKGLQYSLYTE